MKATTALVAACLTLALPDGGAAQGRGWSIPYYGGESEPVVADGILYVGSSRGELHAVELASGRTRWMHATGVNLPFSAPMLIDAPEPMAGVEAMSRHLADPWPARRVINAAPFVDRNTVFLASEDRSFYALDAQSGVLRWRLDLPRPATGAALAAGRVVFTAGNTVLAYGHDGRRAWSYELYPEVPDDPREAPRVPVVIDDLVYVMARMPDPKAGPWNQNRLLLVALDARSGALRWSYQASSSYAHEPLIANGLVFLSTTYPEGVHALDAGTGALRWRFTAAACHANVSMPLLAGGRVVFATDCAIYGLEPETGRPAWSAAGSWQPYLFGRRASGERLLASGYRDGKLHALNAMSGQALWSARPGPGLRVLAIGEAVAYVASRSSRSLEEEKEVVVAVDLQNGRTLWKLDAGAEVSSGPLLLDGRACFTSGVAFTARTRGFVPVQGKLVCADARTGKP